MNESKTKNWQESTYRLYLVSLIAWAVGFAVLVVHLLTSDHVPDSGLTSPTSSIMLMLLALPGLTFFFWQSRKVRSSKLVEATKAFERIMLVQNITGIIAAAGGLLGSLPFLVNFFGILSMSPSDFWMNIGLIVPWVSLYGFITTYIVALVINRRRKKQNHPDTAA